MQPITAESGRWCELVHYVKESMDIFAAISSSWYILILPELLSSQEPGQLTLVKCAISFLFPKGFISVAFF